MQVHVNVDAGVYANVNAFANVLVNVFARVKVSKMKMRLRLYESCND